MLACVWNRDQTSQDPLTQSRVVPVVTGIAVLPLLCGEALQLVAGRDSIAVLFSPLCGGRNASFSVCLTGVLTQVRSIDEGATAFFECKKCKARWSIKG